MPVFGIALISLYTHLAVSQRGGDGGEREADADERGETPQQEPEGAAERPQAWKRREGGDARRRKPPTSEALPLCPPISNRTLSHGGTPRRWGKKGVWGEKGEGRGKGAVFISVATL